MKNVILFILMSFVLASCGPSQKSIETAIALTQAAIPTSTFTPEPTFTPIPTPTAIPSITPTPRPALCNLMVSSSDFGPLSSFYSQNPMIMPMQSTDTILEGCSATYLGENDLIGNVRIEVVRYLDKKKATDANTANKVLVSFNPFTISTKNEIPDLFFVGSSDDEKTLYASFIRNEINVLIKVDNPLAQDVTVMATLPIIISTNQNLKLKTAGY